MGLVRDGKMEGLCPYKEPAKATQPQEHQLRFEPRPVAASALLLPLQHGL